MEYIVSEERINQAFDAAVTDPTITDLVIDLQPGAVVMSATFTDELVYDVSMTVVPSLVGGVVEWAITEITINGEPLVEMTSNTSADTMTNALLRGLSMPIGGSTITRFDITEDEIILVVRYR